MLQEVGRRSLRLFKENFRNVQGGPGGRRNFVLWMNFEMGWFLNEKVCGDLRC